MPEILTKPEFLCEDYIRQITTPEQFAGLHLGVPARVRDMGHYGVAGYSFPQGYYVRWDAARGPVDILAPYRDAAAGTRLPVHRFEPGAPAPHPAKVMPFRRPFPKEPAANPKIQRYRLAVQKRSWQILEMIPGRRPREVLGGVLSDLAAARAACRELNLTGTVSAPAAVNPRQAHIKLTAVWAFKGRLPHNCDKLCRERGHYYRHKFTSEPYLHQMSEGGFLVTSASIPPATVDKEGATRIYERTDKIEVRLPDGRIVTRKSRNNNSCILGLPGDNFVIEHFS